MPAITPRTALGAARAGVGTVSLLAPDTAARLFGIDPDRADPFIGRLFGSRELALAGALLAARGDDVRRVALAGAAIDAVDAVSSLVEARRGRISTWALVSGGGGAVVFSVLGLLAAREA